MVASESVQKSFPSRSILPYVIAFYGLVHTTSACSSETKEIYTFIPAVAGNLQDSHSWSEYKDFNRDEALNID